MDGQFAYQESVQQSKNRNFQATGAEVKTTSLRKRVKRFLLRWFRLSDELTVKIYHGYGHMKQLHVFGQVFGLSPFPRKKYRRNIWTNSFALIRSFMVKPFPFATLRLCWKDQWAYTTSEADGFFKFDLEPNQQLQAGWHQVEVQLLNNSREQDVLAKGTGLVYLPPANSFGCISDIDDTFLISHSSHLLKRLYVLLTKNAHSRRPFEGVVKHYQLLANASTTPEKPNPFFYVSSSEWNLYDFIVEFARKNEMPAGIYLLNQLKRFNQLLKTGQGKHSGKFTRIVRIMEAFPQMKFILLGDSSQQDPYIYSSIVDHFPNQIFAVYIRDVGRGNRNKVKEVMDKLESQGIATCLFAHSREAIDHSKIIGLIPQDY
jgi:phosphatidate phosphatase APP1